MKGKKINKTWRKVKLGEVTDINKRSVNSNFPYKEIEYIDISSVGTGVLLGTTRYLFSEAPGRAKRLVFSDDIIISTVRPNRRSFYYIKKPKNNWVVSTGFAVLSPKKDTDPRFIYYLISRQKFTDYLSGNVKGSAYPAISTDVIENAEIFIPEYNEQKRIAGILSAFDDKIELNNKINQNLEQTAQAIFKEWFINSEKHAPYRNKVSGAGLKVKSEKLFKLGKIICGKTSSKSNLKYFGGEIPFIKIPDMHNQMFILKTEDSLTKAGAASQKNKFIPRNSICVSCIAIVGLISITTKDSQTNQQINTIIPKSENYLEFLYLALKTIKNDLMLLGSGGSTTLNINTSIFSNIEIPVPKEEMIDKFHKLVNPVFNKILQINKENQKLAALRDLLLPKLMNGEIIVNS